MTAPVFAKSRDIRELAEKLSSVGWERAIGRRLIHVVKKVLNECRMDQSETIGRATTLIDVLNEFVKESPKADRLEVTLRAAMLLADLVEIGRWPERIDCNDLPCHPQDWTFVLAGNTHEGIDFQESLESMGFTVKKADDVDEIISVRRKGPMVLLATTSWLKVNAERFVYTLPAGDGLPDSYLLVAVIDVADFCSHVIARQAGARLLLNLPLDVSSLVGELTGLAWMPRSAFRVLLVDDDAAVLELSAGILRAAGFDVLALTDPASAPNFMEEFAPDVCVLDMEMRACRGTDLATLLRRNVRFARLPVVYLSAFADCKHQLDARLAGANDFLVKPVDARLLVAAVMTQARQHRMLEAAYRQQYQAQHRIDNFRCAIDAHIALSVTDMVGAIVDVNQKFCEMSGYKREELLGRNHRIVKSGHHPAAVFDDMWQTISAGGIWQGEVQSRRKDGELYWAWSTVAPMLDAHGMPEQYVAVRTDITEQKCVQVELNSNNRLLDLLLQALECFVSSNDMQDFSGHLLDGILALTQSAYGFIGGVLHDEDGTPYVQTHAITDISWNEETRRLHEETRVRGMEFRNLDTLFGAVLKSGETVIANDPDIDPRRGGVPSGHPPLNSFLGMPILYGGKLVGMVGLANRPGGYDEAVVNFLQPFTATYAAAIESVRLAQFRQQAIDELHHARDVAEKTDRAKFDYLAGWERELRTLLNASLGHAQILLMDDRLDGNTHEQAREILRSGQQAVRMISELIERMGKDAQLPVSEMALLTATTQGSAGHCILVAEDNLANQGVLRMQLETLGFRADIAADGATALEKWQTGGHALILADRNMPRMDGLELTRAIRAREKDSGAYVPIVAITAVQHPEELALCRQAGMDDALPKPIEIGDLRRMLERWLPRASPLASQFSDALVPDTSVYDSKTALDIDYLVRIVGRVETSQARELVDLFTAMANNEFPVFRQQLAERNGRTLSFAMHKLKSSARMVGALRFAALAESIEEAARAGRLEAVAMLLPELENTLQDVEFAASRLLVPAGTDFVTTSGRTLPRRVLVVDDDPVVRRQMTLLLSSLGVGKVVAVEGAEMALAEIALDDDGNDLLITDLNMPGTDGIEFLRCLAENGYRGRLILASGVEDMILQTAAELARAKGLNLCGTLKKPVTADALLQLLMGSRKKSVTHTLSSGGIKPSPSDLLEGIHRDEFDVHFQPKVDTATLRVVGVEALARWRHNGELVSPDAFISTAEQHDLIGELSQLLLTKALLGGASLSKAGFPLSVAVNLSANWLTDIQLPEFVFATLQATGFPADRLILEITETGVMADIATALDVLTRLRLKGFKLSIDDFGVGYSSMEQLQRLPFNELKLDRSFVHGASEKPTSRAILASSIGMAKKLNLSTVAEGVEKQADLDLLRGLGCDFVQGWLVAKAMPLEDLLAWLQTRGSL